MVEIYTAVFGAKTSHGYGKKLAIISDPDRRHQGIRALSLVENGNCNHSFLCVQEEGIF